MNMNAKNIIKRLEEEYDIVRWIDDRTAYVHYWNDDVGDYYLEEDIEDLLANLLAEFKSKAYALVNYPVDAGLVIDHIDNKKWIKYALMHMNVDKACADAHECLLNAQAYAEKLDKVFEEAIEYFSK